MTSPWLLLAGLGLGTGPPPAAPPTAIRPELSRSTVRLGEPFESSVGIRHGLDESVELVPPADLGPFALAGVACRETRGERGALTACTARLQLLDLGEHEVPAMQLRVNGPAGERLVPVAGAPVRAVGTTDPKTPAGALELRGPAAPPVLVPSWRLALGAGGALLAVLLAYLLVRLLRRRRAGGAAPALPPGERFARRVEEILALDLPRRGRGREHVDRLADATREVLAAVAPQAALDLTTAELLATLAARPARGLDLDALGRDLALADLVKFARHQPSAAACDAATDGARELARRLRPAAPGEVAA